MAALESGGGGGGALKPRAAAFDLFQWQGQQTALARNGQACTGEIALSLGDRATCFTAADGSLKCAGRINTSIFGNTFTTVPGRSDVEQILIAPTVNSDTGNAICVRQGDGTAWCMGDYHNNGGQFGVGYTGPSATFVQWGGRSDLKELGTAGWNEMCALSTDGLVRCAGYPYGSTPVPVGVSFQQRFWVSAFGSVMIDDPNTFRSGEGTYGCTVTAQGFSCPFAGGPPQGTPGAVVTGGQIQDYVPVPNCPFMSQRQCWLESSGTASCLTCDVPTGQLLPKPVFATGRVLFLASHYASDSMCAVYDDGSLWCFGRNNLGMLGTGDEMPRTTPVMVQPPGSVRVGCQQ